MPQQHRMGVAVPFPGMSIGDHVPLVRSIEASGFTDLWSYESNSYDCISMLSVAALSSTSLRLGPGIANVFTRGPATLAMSVLALCDLAPDRLVIGLGSSTKNIVEQWNGVPFKDPVIRVASYMTFLRAALSGAAASISTDGITAGPFRLGKTPNHVPPLFMAALGPRMMKMAMSDADGVILALVSPGDCRTILEESLSAPREGFETVVNVLIAKDLMNPESHRIAQRTLGSYLSVDVYRSAQERLGHSSEPSAKRIEDLVAWGTVESIASRLQEYFDAGIQTVVLHFLPPPRGEQEEFREWYRVLLDALPRQFCGI